MICIAFIECHLFIHPMMGYSRVINKIMKYQSLPKNISTNSKQSMKDIGEPAWTSFIRPVDESMPEHSFQCECAMCKVFEYKRYL